jgi:glycerol kinase
MLPEVKDCAADFGVTEAKGCSAPRSPSWAWPATSRPRPSAGLFRAGHDEVDLRHGLLRGAEHRRQLVRSKNRLLSTIAYRLDGKTTYALEGSIFVAGAAVQWLRDGIKAIGKAEESGVLARRPTARTSIWCRPSWGSALRTGTRTRAARSSASPATGPGEFARAALESVAFQTRDLLDAMRKDWREGEASTVLRVDGGMVASDWTMQRLADILDAPVDRPTILETTALGAAWLAGSRAGVWPKWRNSRNPGSWSGGSSRRWNSLPRSAI